MNQIRIGVRTNIRDGSILHVTVDKWSLNIGIQVTVGHGTILHGCTVENHCLIGMGIYLFAENKNDTHQNKYSCQ